MTDEKKAATPAAPTKNTDTVSTNAAPGPQSTKPVAPGSTSIKDPDEGPKNPIPDNQQANHDKARESEEAKLTTGQPVLNEQQKAAAADLENKARIEAEEKEKQAKAQAEAEAFERARNEPDGQLTAEQQAELDKLNGDDPDDVFADEDNVGDMRGAPDNLREVVQKFHKLHAGIPATTPNEHVVWGAAGVTLTLGDIRTLIKYMR